MNIQIFGTNKSFDTKKAQRWFKERGIRFQMVDLKEKGLSRGEFDNVYRAVGGWDKLVDPAAKDKDTLALLQKLGFSGAILKPETHALVRMYGAMGFVPGTGIREFSCRADGHPLSIRAVNSEEYGKIRQQLLPEGGVIQDSGDLQLLAAQAQLYAGEDFLLAAAAEGERLRGIELLGNADAAPGILTVLGLKSGSFRTPGSDTPFTMLCPLAEGCAVPSYFGIVLD